MKITKHKNGSITSETEAVDKKWDGQTDRRTNGIGARLVCPLHGRLCQDLEENQTETKKKVPIWVLGILMLLLMTFLGSFMTVIYTAVTKNSSTLSEVAMNQRIVMKELSLEYQRYE